MRRQVLDLAAADAELGLAAAVAGDVALGAPLVGPQQLAPGPDPRRLDVDRAREERELLDVGDPVDRRVPRDPVAVGLERGVGLRHGEVRILEERVRQPLGDAPVEGRVGRGVDDRPLVGALEVDRLDRAGLGQRVDERVVPRRRRVELELHERVRGDAPRHRLEARRLAQPERDDERDRLRRPPERRRERRPRLAQREVGGGRLDRPAPVLAEGGHRRLGAVEEVDPVEVAGEGVERPLARERQHRTGLLLGGLLLRVVGHVLAEALLTGASQMERGRAAVELPDLPPAALELVGVDGQRKVGESVIGGHGRRNLPMPSRRPAKMPPRDRGAALLGAHRADRARRGAPGGSRARAPAGRGSRPGQGARPRLRHVARVDGRRDSR